MPRVRERGLTKIALGYCQRGYRGNFRGVVLLGKVPAVGAVIRVDERKLRYRNARYRDPLQVRRCKVVRIRKKRLWPDSHRADVAYEAEVRLIQSR